MILTFNRIAFLCSIRNFCRSGSSVFNVIIIWGIINQYYFIDYFFIVTKRIVIVVKVCIQSVFFKITLFQQRVDRFPVTENFKFIYGIFMLKSSVYYKIFVFYTSDKSKNE